MTSLIDRRLKRLEQSLTKGKEGLAIVLGLGKTSEQIDEEVAKLRAAGHQGRIIIIDV